MSEYSAFTQKLISVVRSIPHGKVVSYGQVAAYIGVPRAARQVGWILRVIGKDVPWWRVISNSGRITIKGNRYADKVLQKKLLEQEGIEVIEGRCGLEVDIKKHRFNANNEQLKTWGLSEEYRERILIKYGL